MRGVRGGRLLRGLPRSMVLRPALEPAAGATLGRLVDRLVGRVLPEVTLSCYKGKPVHVARVADEKALVIYTYPGVAGLSRAAVSDVAQQEVFDRHAEDLRAHTLTVVGLSSEPARAQLLRVARHRVNHELWSDPDLVLADALDLPSHSHQDVRCYERLVLVTRNGVIEKAFFPIDSPQHTATQVITWLKATAR
jgi:peroxiredoxin